MVLINLQKYKDKITSARRKAEYELEGMRFNDSGFSRRAIPNLREIRLRESLENAFLTIDPLPNNEPDDPFDLGELGLSPNLSHHDEGLIPNFRTGLKSQVLPYVLSISPFDPDLVKNIGIDLRLDDTVWISDKLFKVDRQQHLSRLEGAKKAKIKDRFVCKPDPSGSKIYYFLTHEKIIHLGDLEYKVDSKSTTGRLGCMSHQASNGQLFEGRILIALQPFVFPIEITPGETCVSQAIFRYSNTPLMSNDEIREVWGEELAFYRENKLVDLNNVLRPQGLEMTFSTKRAYLAKLTKEPVDPNKENYYDPKVFFEEIDGNDEFILKPYSFYLFGTREKVALESICGELSRESSTAGTGLWSHFAGFFMPGYQGEITLECRNNMGSERCISHGDPAGLVTVDRVLTDEPIKFEGQYQGQKAPRLPKVFKITN